MNLTVKHKNLSTAEISAVLEAVISYHQIAYQVAQLRRAID